MKEQQEKYNLPEGWELVKLNDLAIIVTGNTPPTNNRIYFDGEVPFFKPSDLGSNYVNDAKEKLSLLGKEYSRTLPKGSILITCIGATIGKSSIISREGAFNQQINGVLPFISNPLFFYYQIISPDFQKLIKENASATTISILNKTKLGKLPFLMPPLDEQDLIVSKLEELFSCIDKTKEQLVIILNQIKVYRQSILKNAYNGQLTKKWRSENPDNNSTNNLPVGWHYTELSKTVSHKPKRLKASGESKLKFIGLDSIEPNTLHASNIHNFSDFKSSAIYFTKDQILYSRMRPYLNKVWKADFEGACSGEFLVLECSDMILPDYLKYKLHSMDFVAFATERSSGDRPRVSFDKISDYQIPLCSIDEQAEIVRIIDHHFSNADKISSWVIESLEKLKVLEKVILKQAFEGKLTYQNLQEESTRVLLENIKKEIDTYLSEEIIRKKSLPKSIIMTDKLKTIIELLRESNVPVSPDKLWQNSDMQDDIDGFYAELKKYVEEGVIEEIPRKGKDSFLKLVDKNEN